MAGKALRVRGLIEFQKALRAVDKELGPELRKGLNEVAEVVAGEARSRVPSRTGKARASIVAGSSQRGAAVKVGGTRAPYYMWLDFGGRVGRNKSVARRFVPGGRYLYPSLAAKEHVMLDKLEEVLTRLSKQAGL